MVLTALGVGLGETFMWPRLVIVFGSQVQWLLLLGVTIQLFVMLEMARWAMSTGESIFYGAYRIHPAVMWFFWGVATLVYIWPGHVSLGAQALSTITGIDWVPLAIGGILLIGVVLTVAPVVYNALEAIITVLISVLVIGAAIVASMVGSPAHLWSTITGLVSFGYVTPLMVSPEWLPVIVGSIAFAGPSGMQQMWYNAGPIELLTWVLFQAMFGTAYGIGFLVLHRRLSRRPGS